ncbi:MAG: VWA domain-containing protein [Chloroflexi bacterium]|nr:VWA domain-containing protein [Chloroflexota bacterium]MYF82329.1 VWA domain-containing protein [Chloroflexota bacterium]MYI03470.1 VWA domain-containing protein [Chloroflexota bacterium]
MRLDDPALLALLLLLIPYTWLLRREVRLPRPSYLLPQLFGAPPVAGEDSRQLRTLPFLGVLRAVALILIIVAVARPQATTVEAVRPSEGIDIVLVIDASTSMAFSRISGAESRMEAARRVARDFVAERKASGADRIGLVMFQRRPLVLSPLTLDLDAIDEMIAVSVRSGLIPDGTALGVATMEAIDLLRGSDAASRIVVVLTDGENNVPDITPNQAAAVARAVGVRLYTIGLPTQVRQVGVALNELTLVYMADETGGVYFRATDARELSDAYQSISDLERERVGEERFLTTRELGPWLLLAAGLMIVLELALRSTRWRRLP